MTQGLPSETGSPPIKASLFGPVSLTGPSGEQIEIKSRKNRALIAILLLSPDQRASRQRLQEYLWGDRGIDQARASLRQNLHALKRDFSSAGVAPIKANREWVWLQQGLLSNDVAELATTLKANMNGHAEQALLKLGSAQLLEDVDFGDGFRAWLTQTRADVDAELAADILSNIKRLDELGERASALSLADAWLSRSPLDETVAAAAIRIERTEGLFAAAHRRYESLKEVLFREMGVVPSPEVEAAYEVNSALQQRLAQRDPATTNVPLLAVLAFENRSSDKELAYFSEGVAEDILARVSRSSGLKTISRASSFQIRGEAKAPKKVGRVLGATHVLDGTVQRSENRMRISAVLFDCRTEERLWSGQYDHVPNDLFTVQDSISAAVAAELDLALNPARQISRVDPAAYDLYLQARRHSGSAIGIEKCIGLLERAVEIQPDFAEAWGSLAMAHALQTRWLSSPDSFAADRERAVTAAERALAINPDIGQPLVAMSLLERPSAFAVRESLLRRALDLSPNDPEVLKHLSDFTASVGRLRESHDFIMRARELDPLNPLIANNAANILADLGDIEGAYAAFRAIKSQWPSLDWTLAAPLMTAAIRGDWDEVAEFQSDNPAPKTTFKMAMRVAEIMCTPPDARKAKLGDLAARELEKDGSTGFLTLIMLHRSGQADDAYEWAERSSFDFSAGQLAGGSFLIGLLFGGLNGGMREDPRFVAICEKLGLCHYWASTNRWPDFLGETNLSFDFRSAVLSSIANQNALASSQSPTERSENVQGT
ncbi:MAG: BTAD domain-containing putative transcriptional regulator [Pseudomonadota bacterium]